MESEGKRKKKKKGREYALGRCSNVVLTFDSCQVPERKHEQNLKNLWLQVHQEIV